MVTPNYTPPPDGAQKTSRFDELETTLSQLNDRPLLTRLAAYRRTGRPGYPLRSLWRAYVCSYLLDHKYTNVLVRELEDNPEFREFCGFAGGPPHRTTVLRFFHRLAHHADLVEAAFVNLTERIRELLPDLGRVVAIDSTVVRSHSNPNRPHISDPEASWTAKTSARYKDGREWYWGYKLHMLADVNYGLPLAHLTTTAKRPDSPVLPEVYAHAEKLYKWLKPDAAIADRGYDAQSNHHYLYQKGITPVIHIRKSPQAKLYDGIYTKDGVPTCIGQVPMRYVRSDPQKGHLYRCVGCPLAKSTRGGIRHCDTEVWEDPSQNIRLFGAGIRRNSPEWNALYSKRQGIERVFKSMKQSRRLEKHGFRGLRKITLHALMSVLAYQATALVKLQAGKQDEMRWMVRRVA